MALPSNLPKLALIAGPTASGKSALAVALAERHNGTVINADSAQVYRDLRVLSARPSMEEEARAPHRLFGHVDGPESYSAARWAGEAKAAIAEAHETGRLPILVGGTGMYLRTLLDGIAPIPEIAPDVRNAVRALPVAESYAMLERADPQAASRLRPTDTTRVARALEVVQSTGVPIEEWQKRREGGIGGSVALMPVVLLPDRAWLFERCDRRFGAMVRAGALDEVRALLARRDIPASAPVRCAIGVEALAKAERGECDLDTAIEAARTDTRRYAKRQYTWFRNQPPATWTRTDETQTNDLMSYFERYFL
ncbi:tRNA (adenosine(37)-N6)-dimethylallyltransferase MiaA [Stakelama marina]|uniref:tRNA dimethylallyltransferase n=1 Tax=Stakelama marina TaxID=2826939 RepID=A0A8T4IIG3_9SPHN|nr:tRNA (adenosine(37)-N6)-dimethylallyltransferase MiaA [Stakelama marina]MBR0551986.1 tRNA (adenosine(37)-N6)-dimethylallyltransferase MiaA [Stakelama marina]